MARRARKKNDLIEFGVEIHFPFVEFGGGQPQRILKLNTYATLLLSRTVFLI